MARPDLFSHVKFRRLSRAVGSVPLAVGMLELLWHAGYATGDDNVGFADDVEHLCRWEGESGALTSMLVNCGFLDKQRDGSYVIHHLYDNAPEYVRKRIKRRTNGGQTADKWTPSGGQTDANVRQTATVPDQTRPTHVPDQTRESSRGVARATPLPLHDMVQLWNDHSPPLHHLKPELSPSRRKRASARWHEHPDLDYWRQVIASIVASDFCLGHNDRGWKANWDWLMRPDVAERILEGNYANKPRDVVSPGVQRWIETGELT